jgi:hypothetical protein
MLPAFAGLPDNRKPQGKMYRTEDVMMGGLSLFLFKEGSRNQLNNDRNSLQFSKHYERLFDLKLPHQDIVKKMLCSLEPKKLDIIKMGLMVSVSALPYHTLHIWMTSILFVKNRER